MRKDKTKTKSNKAPVPVKGTIGKIDIPFLILVSILLVFGLVMVASSSYVTALYKYGDSYYYIKNQLLFAFLGVAAMLIVAFFDYHRLRKFAFLILMISVVLLIIVLLPTPISITANGAKRWLKLVVQFQPSEIAKFAIILAFASYISDNYKHMTNVKITVFPLFAALMVVTLLVLLEPHLSGAILIFSIGAIMMFIGGTPKRYFIGGGILGITGFAAMVAFTPYMQTRINTWRNPMADAQGAGYQIVQSLYAIGSGGLFGLGLGQSRQKHLYIPEPQNDYIFSITLEELGFVGGIFIILLFVLFVWRGFVIAFHARDKFGSLLVIGIVSRVAVQTVLNIAVVTNALPSTGISLPFFSYGGTSLVILLFEMGVVLSVSRFCYMEKT